MFAAKYDPALLPSLQQQRRQKHPRAPAAPSRRLRRGRASDGAAHWASATNDVASASTTTSTTSTTSSSSSSSLCPSTTATASAIAEAKAALREASPAARKGDADAVAAVVAAVEKLSALALEQQQRAEEEEASSSSLSSTSSPRPRFPAPPEPSTWETLYTDAKVGSNGKFGPLQGEARQLFVSSDAAEKGTTALTTTPTTTAPTVTLTSAGGRFINRVAFPTVSLPLLQVDFSGSWLPKPRREDRLEVIFEESRFGVLGGRVRLGGGVFPPPPEKGSVKGHWVMKFADDDVRAFVTNKMSLVVLGRVRSEE